MTFCSQKVDDLLTKVTDLLPFVNQENRGWAENQPPIDYEGQKYPIRNKVKTETLPEVSI